ncbi:MAG: hypothetical protein AAFV77_06725, partial [Planctomycetota bacterium]
MENHAQLATPSRTPALGSLLLIARDIKLAHSVFALPFAVLAAFMVAPRIESGGIDWVGMAGLLALVLVCMVAASLLISGDQPPVNELDTLSG